MQIFGLHKSVYKLNRHILPEENLKSDILEIKNKLIKWEKLKFHKVPDQEIAVVLVNHILLGVTKKSLIALYNSLNCFIFVIHTFILAYNHMSKYFLLYKK